MIKLQMSILKGNKIVAIMVTWCEYRLLITRVNVLSLIIILVALFKHDLHVRGVQLTSRVIKISSFT